MAVCVALAGPALLSGSDAPIAFTDVAAELGVRFVHAGSPTTQKYLIETMGAGVATFDYDNDGRLDLFFVNGAALSDPMSTSGPPPDKRESRFHNRLYRQTPDRRFEDTTSRAGVAGTRYGMGVVFDDQDNDGWPDVLVTTLSNQLYANFRNERTGTFMYATHATGLDSITRLLSGWGLAFIDADNDGWRDLLVAQGHVLDTVEITAPHIAYRQPLLVARNLQARFVDVSATAGPAFTVPRAARGLAVGDLDADGRIDAVVNTLNGPAVVLRNVTKNAGHWIGVRLVGRRSNRDGIGATVEVTTDGGQTRMATVNTTGSYLSASDRTAHFGLGAASRVSSVRVRWPSGTVQSVGTPPIDQVLTITETQASERR